MEKLNIIKGRKIKNKNEIILDELLNKDYKIGDYITFKAIDDDINDLLKNNKYKVVGFSNSSEYLMDDLRDISIKGKEMVFAFAYIDKENFKTDDFNQVDISYKKTKNMDRFSDEYKSFVKEKRENLRKDLKNRPIEVLKKTRDEANKKLDKEEKKLSDGEKELKEQEDKLIDANEKLKKGLDDYNKAENEYKIKIKDGEDKLNESKSQMDSALKKLNDGKKTYYENLASFNEEIKKKWGKVRGF